MSRVEHTKRMSPPKIDDLFARFLTRSAMQPDLHTDNTGDVEPHEIVGLFRADVATLWSEAVAVFTLYGITTGKLDRPPEWAAYTQLPGCTLTTPFAAGFIPQQVGDFTALFEPNSFTAPTGTVEDVSANFPRLWKWVEVKIAAKNPVERILAAGIACVLGRPRWALEQLDRNAPETDDPVHVLWANQRAAAMWLLGDPAAAVAIWSKLPVTAITDYNIGMAAAVMGDLPTAQSRLKSAADRLSDNSGWSHLARLLTVLAD